MMLGGSDGCQACFSNFVFFVVFGRRRSERPSALKIKAAWKAPCAFKLVSFDCEPVPSRSSAAVEACGTNLS